MRRVRITAKPRADVSNRSALRLSMAAFGEVPTGPPPFARTRPEYIIARTRSPDPGAHAACVEGEPLSFGFDAFGDDVDPDRAATSLADRVGGDASHESAIELHVPGARLDDVPQAASPADGRHPTVLTGRIQ